MVWRRMEFARMATYNKQAVEMDSKVGETCLEYNRKVDAEEEESDEDAIEEERNDILVV